jgi:hypothetical protein
MKGRQHYKHVRVAPAIVCFCVCGPSSNLQAGTRAARPKQPLHAGSSSQKGGRFDVLGLLQQGEEVGTYVTYICGLLQQRTCAQIAMDAAV